MDEMKPGTLPWALHPTDEGRNTVYRARGGGIASDESAIAVFVGAGTRTREEAYAHAAYAVHTANAFPVLVEALEAFQAHVIRHSCTWDDDESGSHHHPVWQQVANALALARGQQ